MITRVTHSEVTVAVAFRNTGSARPKGPQHEAQRAKSGGGVLEDGQPAHPHQLWDLGSVVSSPSGV